MSKNSKKNLGEILLEQGVINQDTLSKALNIQNRRLGDILIEEKLADPVAIVNALKDQARLGRKKRASRIPLDPEVLDDWLFRIEELEGLLKTQPQVLSKLSALRLLLEGSLLDHTQSTFAKAKLFALQLAEQLGKKIEIDLQGGDLVLDRSLLVDLWDILVHLIRNALVHGLEIPAERLKAKKREIGLIRIRLETKAGNLLLTVADDGAGVDEAKLLTKAGAMGLLNPNLKHTREELYACLFNPGFSLAEKSTGYAGRGVGLDVVEATAIRLGGKVSMRSKHGVGCAFYVEVPFYHARMSIVPFRIGSEWVGIPAHEIKSVEKSSDPKGIHSAASLFFTKHAFKVPFLKVTTRTGAGWAFEEVGTTEDILVRENSKFVHSGKNNGLVGVGRTNHGKTILVLDLTILESAATKTLVF